MRRMTTWLAALIILFTSCQGEKRVNDELEKLEGDRYSGGTFNYNEEEYLKSLYPLNITEVVGSRIIDQIYEGLLMFDQHLSPVPCLAEKYDINEDGTVFTFHLRRDVKFHDDPCFEGGKGRMVTARDFKYCFDRLYTYNPSENQAVMLYLHLIKGADEHLEATKKGESPEGGVSGVKVIDDHTLEITLSSPNATFLAKMALPGARVYPREAVEMYGSDLRKHTVGTGPFQLETLKEDQIVFLTRNTDYWGQDEFGNQLPYIDNIKVSFIQEKKTELLAFTKSKLDMVYRLPLEMKEEIVDAQDNLKEGYTQYTLQYNPSMSIQYYGFLHLGEIFDDINVRKAFCYAVDRKKIVDFTLKGSGVAATMGYVPPGTGTYDATQIKGYEFDPGLAQKYMEQAGYPKGQGFPEITLQINSGGGRNEQVAEAVQKMLEENLNIRVKILTIPWAQHSEAIESAKTDFWRLGWIADYPDPENFLNLFYGIHYEPDLSVKSYVNSFRYENEEFDRYLAEALRTFDESERNALYAKADQIAVNDAVVLPLFYDKDYRLLQPNVRNFPQNSMENRIFREVYFVPTN